MERDPGCKGLAAYQAYADSSSKEGSDRLKGTPRAPLGAPLSSVCGLASRSSGELVGDVDHQASWCGELEDPLAGLVVEPQSPLNVPLVIL